MGNVPWLSAETALMAPYRRALVASARLIADKKIVMTLWSNKMHHCIRRYKQFNSMIQVMQLCPWPAAAVMSIDHLL
jgi:hypothetical protein